MQNEERDKLRKQTVTLIRSLLISSKGGVNLEKINRDYREMIGKGIPFRDLGYVSLEEFLDQSPDLCRVSYTPQGIILHGVATAADAHVASLVSRQSSKKKAKPSKPPARRPNNLRPWQPPTPSIPFQSQNRQSYQQHRFQSGGRPLNRPGGSGRFPVIQNRNPQTLAQYQHQRLRTPNFQGSSNMSGNHNTPGPNGDNRMNNMMNRRPGGQSQSGQQQKTPQQQSHQFQHRQKANLNTTPPSNKNSSVKFLKEYFSQNGLGELVFKTATMEVKSGGGSSGNSNQKNNKGKKVTTFVSTVKVGDQSFQTFPNSFPSKELAEEAAASLAIAKLSITSSNGSSSGNSSQSGGANHTQAHHQNNSNNNIMSMPIGHFEDLNSSNADVRSKEDHYKTEEKIEQAVIDRIFELVGKRTNGVWSTQIDVEYKRKYQKSLPDKWPTLIEPSKEASLKLRVDNPIEGRYIIYPIINQDTSNSSPNDEKSTSEKITSQSKSSSATPSSSPPQKRPPKLELPEDNNWYIYVTCVHSTVNVCLRILGDVYSTKFDDMVTNMELKYFESDQVPLDKDLLVTSPQVGNLYAAKVEGDWHRVEVTHVHGLGVTCFFIDHGDEDVLKVKDLRRLLPEFLELAPQAKSVRLAGLEDLAGDQGAQADLTNAALGRSLVGQVHSMDKSGISMILYDTNTDEDININEKILEKFLPNSSLPMKNGSAQPASTTVATSSATPEPASEPPTLIEAENSSTTTTASVAMKDLQTLDLTSLSPLRPTEVPEPGEFLDVNVTLAASPSNFTVQPWQNTTLLENFQSDLNGFYNDAKNAYGRPLTNADVAKGDKYYAGQHMDGKWYRVRVNATIDETTVAAKIVDFGDCTMIPLENLQPLWPQFRELPMQSINASLTDIVAINGDWSTDDTIWFSERVVNNQFVTKIRDVSFDALDNNVKISVSLIDTSHPTTDIYIEKQLVEEKRAVYLCV